MCMDASGWIVPLTARPGLLLGPGSCARLAVAHTQDQAPTIVVNNAALLAAVSLPCCVCTSRGQLFKPCCCVRVWLQEGVELTPIEVAWVQGG